MKSLFFHIYYFLWFAADKKCDTKLCTIRIKNYNIYEAVDYKLHWKMYTNPPVLLESCEVK